MTFLSSNNQQLDQLGEAESGFCGKCSTSPITRLTRSSFRLPVNQHSPRRCLPPIGDVKGVRAIAHDRIVSRCSRRHTKPLGGRRSLLPSPSLSAAPCSPLPGGFGAGATYGRTGPPHHRDVGFNDTPPP